MSIGAYFCALITLRVDGIPGFLLGILAGGAAAALAGLLVGLPTLRLKGDYLAIATLGMAEIMYAAQTVSGTSYITLAPYVFAAIIYFCINYPASKAIEAIERRMRRGDKQ